MTQVAMAAELKAPPSEQSIHVRQQLQQQQQQPRSDSKNNNKSISIDSNKIELIKNQFIVRNECIYIDTHIEHTIHMKYFDIEIIAIIFFSTRHGMPIMFIE